MGFLSVLCPRAPPGFRIEETRGFEVGAAQTLTSVIGGSELQEKWGEGTELTETFPCNEMMGEGTELADTSPGKQGFESSARTAKRL